MQYTKSCIKKHGRSFFKSSTLHENITISKLKERLRNLYKSKNFKPEIKPMIENSQEKLRQVESKQSKGAKIRANIRWKLEGEKCSKTFFKIIKTQNMQNQVISELYTQL